MKAMLLETYGDGYDFVQHDVSRPVPMPGQVLIRVVGSSFNPIDNKIATLGDQLGFAPALPAILGMDVAGIVEDVGGGMSRFQPGDAVFGCAGGLGSIPGALAEFMVADERLLALAPTCMDLADAAALPLVSITAWLGLFNRARISSGETLLVQGGAGGVGHVAVQLGRYAGAHVHATVSGDTKGAVVESLGGIPVNYHDVEMAELVADTPEGEGFNVVFDTVGGKTLDASFLAAANNGRVITTVSRSTHDLSLMHAKSLSLHVVFMLLPLFTGEDRHPYGQILGQIATLVEQDALAILLDQERFSYTDIGQAHRYWASGEAMGKIVIDVAD